jgi:hypothetical protein
MEEIRKAGEEYDAKCHRANAKCTVQTLVLIQEELTKEESRFRTRQSY